MVDHKHECEKMLSTAGEMEQLNIKLSEILESSRETINALTMNNWTGADASETQASYNRFANENFEDYKKALNSYVEHLRDVAAGFGITVKENTKLADAFK